MKLPVGLDVRPNDRAFWQTVFLIQRFEAQVQDIVQHHGIGRYFSRGSLDTVP